MAEDRVRRRLAAILAADVAGYSRLMGADEEGTLARLTAHLDELVRPAIDGHDGRLVKTTGDGLIAEFASAVDSVRCALAIQDGMAARNETMEEDRRIRFRIGINLSDVIVQGEDVFGDGVNVAARLEGLADPDGVVISGKVRDEVQGRIGADLEDLGPQEVKNIAEPIRAYRVETNERPAAIEVREPASTYELPDKPSIAVLPFANMSRDAEQEYFADGIAEDLITTLSRFHWFFVIARNSSFAYKRESPDILRVARELGVRYVLEGSVRKAGNRVRITAQLIDVTTGNHIWAERYDRELDDIFAVQDDITEAIATAVAPSFVSAEARRVERKPPESYDAWDHVIRGNWHVWRLAREDASKAVEQFSMAIERDPKSSAAHSGLAVAYLLMSYYGWSDDVDETIMEAHRVATNAVQLDPNDAAAHCALAWINFWAKRHDAAIENCARALALNPNLALAEAILGGVYSWTGDYDDSMLHTEKAERLSPRDPELGLWGISRATAEFCNADYEAAVEYARASIEATPSHPSAWRMLASTLALSGRIDEARDALAELLRLVTNVTIEHCRRTVPAKHPAHLETYLEGLRKAGLPE